MGLDRHAVSFLRYAATQSSLGEVATIGRQGLAIGVDDLREIVGLPYEGYCEDLLLNHFGASLVDSYDYSGFEGATHLIDLNEPVEPERQYDTIIDAGTVEHVYNAAEALRTMTKMCRVGGRIIHVSPANNFCNHGFWQLSPELFFSLYSEGNGFANTEVFLSDLGEKDFWYRLSPPSDGNWSDATSPRAMFAMTITEKVRDVPRFVVQQAGYAVSWERPKEAPAISRRERLKRRIEGTPIFPVLRYLNRVLRPADHALRSNPDFRKVKIADLWDLLLPPGRCRSCGSPVADDSTRCCEECTWFSAFR